MTVLVKVMLKPGVLDPQGKAIADALHPADTTADSATPVWAAAGQPVHAVRPTAAIEQPDAEPAWRPAQAQARQLRRTPRAQVSTSHR